MALIPCPQCGNQISDAAHVCPRCGHSFHKADNAQNNLSNSESTDPGDKKKSKVWLWVGVAIVAFVLIILIVSGGTAGSADYSGTYIISECKSAIPTKIDYDLQNFASLTDQILNAIATKDNIKIESLSKDLATLSVKIASHESKLTAEQRKRLDEIYAQFAVQLAALGSIALWQTIFNRNYTF